MDGNLAVLSVAIVKKGEAEIPGLTDNTIPRRLGPKRASKIRKLFNLTKDDDVCQYVIKRPLPLKDGKKQKFAAPKVQRLVTPVMLQRKRHRLALKRRTGEKNRLAAAEFAQVIFLSGFVRFLTTYFSDSCQEAEGSQGGQGAEAQEIRLPARV